MGACVPSAGSTSVTLVCRYSYADWEITPDLLYEWMHFYRPESVLTFTYRSIPVEKHIKRTSGSA